MSTWEVLKKTIIVDDPNRPHHRRSDYLLLHCWNRTRCPHPRRTTMTLHFQSLRQHHPRRTWTQSHRRIRQRTKLREKMYHSPKTLSSNLFSANLAFLTYFYPFNFGTSAAIIDLTWKLFHNKLFTKIGTKIFVRLRPV